MDFNGIENKGGGYFPLQAETPRKMPGGVFSHCSSIHMKTLKCMETRNASGVPGSPCIHHKRLYTLKAKRIPVP